MHAHSAGGFDELARHSAYRSALPVECVYDIRLVRVVEVSIGIFVAGHSRVLGNRLLRILPGNTGESHRLHRLFGGPAQDDAGSHHACGFCGVLRHLSRRVVQMEPSGRIRLAVAGGVFCVPQMVSSQWLQGSFVKSLTARTGKWSAGCVVK